MINNVLRTITAINAEDLPEDVIEYCIEELDCSTTHYQNDIVQTANDYHHLQFG